MLRGGVVARLYDGSQFTRVGVEPLGSRQNTSSRIRPRRLIGGGEGAAFSFIVLASDTCTSSSAPPGTGSAPIWSACVSEWGRGPGLKQVVRRRQGALDRRCVTVVGGMERRRDDDVEIDRVLRLVGQMRPTAFLPLRECGPQADPISF